MQPSRLAALEAVAADGQVTARALAEAQGWTIERAAIALLRAFRAGLLRRQRGIYTLAPRGAERLAWAHGEAP